MVAMATTRLEKLSPSCGQVPTVPSKRMTPMAQTSARWSAAAAERACSGLM